MPDLRIALAEVRARVQTLCVGARWRRSVLGVVRAYAGLHTRTLVSVGVLLALLPDEYSAAATSKDARACKDIGRQLRGSTRATCHVVRRKTVCNSPRPSCSRRSNAAAHAATLQRRLRRLGI